MNCSVYVHEKSYAKTYLGGAVHRARLKAVIKMLRRYAGNSWADVGCSNGFVIASVLKNSDLKFGRIVGYDRSTDLLELARTRHITNAAFSHLDLNQSPDEYDARTFDLVTCFETLEHAADYRAAFKHLYYLAKPGGHIVITVPNETGMPGLAKFVGRYANRHKPYGNFFEGKKSILQYVKRLIFNGPIQDFRNPTTKGYGFHLGFDYRELAAHVRENYIAAGLLRPVENQTTFFGMNVLWVWNVLEQSA